MRSFRLHDLLDANASADMLAWVNCGFWVDATVAHEIRIGGLSTLDGAASLILVPDWLYARRRGGLPRRRGGLRAHRGALSRTTAVSGRRTSLGGTDKRRKAGRTGRVGNSGLRRRVAPCYQSVARLWPRRLRAPL